jgi:SAM-dependent methyltransferase
MPAMSQLPPFIRCPHCHGALAAAGDGLRCAACETTFPSVSGRPDLRPRRAITRTMSFEVGTERPRPESFDFTYPMPVSDDGPLAAAADAELRRPQKSLLSYVPRAPGPGAWALDLGCGSSGDRAFIEALGYQYAGCDPFDQRAPILADGHALPFADASFDVVFALTVMEHFQNPFVAVAEVKRVLKPGGRFIGTVETLVPFHMESYYNMTRNGIFNVLAQGGLRPLVISPSTGWTAFVAHYSGSYWPGLPRRVGAVLAKS